MFGRTHDLSLIGITRRDAQYLINGRNALRDLCEAVFAHSDHAGLNGLLSEFGRTALPPHNATQSVVHLQQHGYVGM